uniref:Uncharacterized protein n=1 Tax=Leersia perrieri TaxID=77586 RepID=A0A0D9VVS6_9ORYZ
MGSDSLPFGLVFGREQASGGYRACSEQYEWQQLALREREQATREQQHCRHDLQSHGETLNDRSCRRSFMGTETKDLMSFSRNDVETEESFAEWD